MSAGGGEARDDPAGPAEHEPPGPARLPAVWSDAYEVDIGDHVYPTRKYRLLRDRLLRDGILSPDDLLEPGSASREDLRRVHTGPYLEKIEAGSFTRREILTLEVPFSPELRRASVICCGGSILAAQQALEEGVAVHLGGGFHHAFPDHGEGFCLLNDVAVAVRALQARDRIRRAAVVDCDVHHGNGTAAIFEADGTVFTFSMHQERNYPVHKPPGDLDIGLPDGTGDRRYLELLRRHLPDALREHGPELVIYLAGADPYREDQLGGLALTKEGLRARDVQVLETSAEAGAAVAVLLAGGYAFRLEDTVDIHRATVDAAREARTRLARLSPPP